MSAGALTLLGPWLITKFDFFLPKLLILNDLLFVERHYSWCSTNIADLWLIAFLARSKVFQHQGAKRQKSSFLGYSYHVTLRVVVYQTLYAYGALWILVISYLLMNSCHSFTFSLQGCFIGPFGYPPVAVMHIQRDTEGYDQRRPLPSHNEIRDFLCMRPANESWRYIVMPSLIGREHTQNGPRETRQNANRVRFHWDVKFMLLQ